MPIEIERKFLVLSESYKSDSFRQTTIVQGYLSNSDKSTIRVRVCGQTAYLTIKGKSNKSGLSRYEWEKEISVAEAQELLPLCFGSLIEKVRYEIKVGGKLFEVDEFLGENIGLTVAEIELDNEDEVFEKPTWLGEEVSGDKRYYNVYLIDNPYKNW
ncbi:CYTH domain-containing protein [Paludibacter sp.]